jgi:hypothetical protein
MPTETVTSVLRFIEPRDGNKYNVMLYMSVMLANHFITGLASLG